MTGLGMMGSALAGLARAWATALALVGMVLMCAVVLPGTPANALSPDEQLKDATLEARARDLSAELRCLVCQNQSIDDSDAPLAKDLRRIVRERLVAGDSNVEVKSYLVQRFGDFVLLKPPFGWHTLLLWLTPALVLLATIGFVVRSVRLRDRRLPSVAGNGSGLSAEEQARLAELMVEARGSDTSKGAAKAS